ncbi:hypothetical protein TNCV_1046861 [Trichonephila clavipes]|nr:hypothetical protein TNCV_1046861 [Trichonephila clavipes]
MNLLEVKYVYNIDRELQFDVVRNTRSSDCNRNHCDIHITPDNDGCRIVGRVQTYTVSRRYQLELRRFVLVSALCLRDHEHFMIQQDNERPRDSCPDSP